MDDSQVDELVSHADLAMYRSKSSGKGVVSFFDTRMDESVKARQALKRSMPGDISGGKFYLLLQPIVDAATRACKRRSNNPSVKRPDSLAAPE